MLSEKLEAYEISLRIFSRYMESISQKADFYRFFTEHDKRRGTNFEETFPEMKGFWNECRHFLR